MTCDHPWKKTLCIGFVCALLSACGADQTPDPQPDPYVQKYNSNLPLSIGASIDYFDSAMESIESMQILDEDLSIATGEEIFEITFDSTEKSLSFFASSTPNEIKIFGIDGPIETSSNGITYQLDKLRFDSPITLFSEFNANSGGTINASALIQSGNSSSTLNDIQIQYQTTNFNTTYSGSYGTLPVTAAFLNANIQASINLLGQTIQIDNNLNNTLLFTPGIGIVRHTGTYVSENHTYNSEISRLNNLPLTIWYNHNNGNPVLSNGSSSTFRMANIGTINPTDYALANMENINAKGWINVQQNSNNYQVSLQDDGNLPQTTTAVEVVFEHKVTERRVSAAVILVAD